MAAKKKQSSDASGITLTDAQKAALKADKWKKGISVHVTRALSALNKIAALGNKKRYTYTSDQVQKVLDALDAKVDAVTKAHSDAPPTKEKFEV